MFNSWLLSLVFFKMYFRCLIIFYSYLRSNCVVKNTNADQKVQTSDAHTKLQKVRGSLK